MLTGHLVVAVDEVVGQCSLGGGVHRPGLGQPGVALEVGDGGGGLRSHEPVDRSFVVVQLAELLLQRLDRGRRSRLGRHRLGRRHRVGRGGGRGRGRGGGWRDRDDHGVDVEPERAPRRS